MKRLVIAILLGIVLSAALFAFAQDSEPMANPECNAENLSDSQTQITQFYTDAQTAFDNGDFRTYLDNLRGIAWMSSLLRALCDNYHFEGDGEGSSSTVIGPVSIVPGIYTVTAVTDGWLIAALEPISGGCGRSPFSMIISEGDAADGAQEVLRIEEEACVALLEVSNITAAWTLDFSLVSNGG